MEDRKIERVMRIISLLERFVDDSYYEVIAESRFTMKMLEEEKMKKGLDKDS